MKRKTILSVCLAGILGLNCLPCAGCAQTAPENALHLFSGIPFSTATPEEFAQVLQETVGATLSEPNATDIQYYAENVPFLGDQFSLMVEFSHKHPGIERIVMHPARKTIWSSDPDEFKGMVEQDIQYYKNTENLLIQQYGEPDWRFFTTNGKKYKVKRYTRFMFPSGQWDAEQMMDICQNNKAMEAHTAWGNVVLDLWVIWNDKGPKKSKSSLTLYYYPKVTDVDPGSIVPLPSASATD